MWVFICGGYRSGSTLHYNLVSAIVEKENKGKRIKIVQPKNFGEFKLRHQDYKKFKIYKSHILTPSIREEFENNNALAIQSKRDIRDVVVSFAIKQNKSFDNIIDELPNHLKLFKAWKEVSPMLESKYEQFAFNLKEEIIRISKYLNISLNEELINNLASEYSLTNQKKYISNKNFGSNNFDGKTLLHSNHINSGANEQWKTKLTEVQIEKIETMASNWLVENGYELSK